MEQQPKKSKKRSVWIFISGGILLILALCVFSFVRASKENPVPGMSFEECLAYTTKDAPGVKVGIVTLENGAANIAFYGSNAERIAYDDYEFEIGSLTKTITAALVMRAVDDGTLQLSDSIDRFIKLPEQDYYPTIERILTHQSGYKSHYFAKPMASNFLSGENSFYGVSRSVIRNQIAKLHLQDRDYPFSYSNFGYSVLGLVLENAYQMRYTDLADMFVQQELGMQHTHISYGTGNLSGYWNWAENDAYLPAGGFLSTADDMAIYARALLRGNPAYLLQAQAPLANINATTDRLSNLGIRMDSIGASWMIDEEHGILWHNGGTSNFSCYLGFDPARQIAVVVLTNLAPEYRIPATILGAKLLLELQEQQ